MLDALWSVVAMPFRLFGWLAHLLGRMSALVLGFLLMVVGVALGAGPLFWLGIPLFLFGLLLTLRALG
jgi:hypothetical protein